ncbi:hypothetical protein DSO57_1028860 [Entomophthora muscae]|nr:hypothetical protein DSO57_1028860 [Entomophthora muscae]
MSMGCYRFPDMLMERDSDLGLGRAMPLTPAGLSLVDRKVPPRAMGGLSELGLPDPYSSVAMTVTVCNIFCSRMQYPYASLMNGSDCRCGKTAIPASLLVEDSYCSSICPGSPTQTCGGSTNFTNLYSTGFQQQSPPPLVIGQGKMDDACLSHGLAVGLGLGSGILGLGVGLASVWLVFILRRQNKQRSGRVHGEWKWEQSLPKPILEKLYCDQQESPSPSIRTSIRNKPKSKLYQLANIHIHSPHTSQHTSQRTSLSISPSSPGFLHNRTAPSSLTDHRSSLISFSDAEDYSQRLLRVVNPDPHPYRISIPDSVISSESQDRHLQIHRTQTHRRSSPPLCSRRTSSSLSNHRKATHIKRALIRLNSRTRL